MVNNSRPLFSMAPPNLFEVCLPPVGTVTTLDCNRAQPQAPAANALMMKKKQVQRATKSHNNSKVSKVSGCGKEISANRIGTQADTSSNGYNDSCSADGE